MAIFDVNNPPASPDSTLDSDLSLVQTFSIEGSTADDQPIAPGDWVDVDPGVGLLADPNWGQSYQVANVYWNENPNLQQVGILYSPSGTGVDENNNSDYFEQKLDTKGWITDNFRHVQRSGS